MRLDCVQQVLRKFRILVADLELDPGTKEGNALEQALDIGIGIGRGLEAEPSRDGLMLLAELARALAQISQLFVVDAKEARIHLLRHFHGRRVRFDFGSILHRHRPQARADLGMNQEDDGVRFLVRCDRLDHQALGVDACFEHSNGVSDLACTIENGARVKRPAC